MRLKLSLLAATLLLALPALAQDNPAPAGRGRGAPAGPPPPPVVMPAAPYHVENDWAALPGRKWGAASGIDIDKDGKSVWVFERCSGLRDDDVRAR